MTRPVATADLEDSQSPIDTELLPRLMWDMARATLCGNVEYSRTELREHLTMLLDERYVTRDALEMRCEAAKKEVRTSPNDLMAQQAYMVIEQLMTSLLDPQNIKALKKLHEVCGIFIIFNRGGAESVFRFDQWLNDYIKALKIAAHVRGRGARF